MKRIKIGLFIDTFFPMVDGVVIAVHNYALELSRYADVVVFAPLPRDKNYHKDLPYEVIRSKRMMVPLTDYDLGTPAFDRPYHKKLKNTYLDIIHIHSPFEIGKTGVQYGKKNNIPIIASLHSQIKKDFLDRTKSKLITYIAMKQIMRTLRKADYFWAVNHKVAEIYHSYGLKQLPEVHFNGTDLMFNHDMEAIKTLRKGLMSKGNEKILLFVGRIDFIKNLSFLIESLEKLYAENFAFQMVFIGSGPHENAMKKMVKTKGISSCVHFVGRVMDRVKLSEYYQAADLFLFPSKYDSSSLVQIEAASQKTPTIFLEHSATADTVTADVNGYITPDDTTLFANKIMTIFEDPEAYQRVCEQAYKDLYHSWKHVVKEAYDKYLEIIKNHQSR